MSKFFILFFLSLQLIVSAKVILYFDVNKTIIAEDLASDKSKNEVIDEISKNPAQRNAILTKLRDKLVFPSFYKLIDYLNCHKIDYTIVLRTFGTDLPRLIPEINRHIAPFRFCLYGEYRKGTLYVDGKPLNYAESFALIKKHRFVAIRDDYEEWDSHGRNRAFGKRFILGDPETLSLFFDDKISFDSSVSIVTPIDVKGRLVSADDYLIKVDTADAILDDCYFINRVEKAFH